jgi:hypothetical protein
MRLWPPTSKFRHMPWPAPLAPAHAVNSCGPVTPRVSASAVYNGDSSCIGAALHLATLLTWVNETGCRALARRRLGPAHPR